MKTPAWTGPVLIVGLALMVAPFFLPAAPTWTAEDAKAREQTWATLHAAIDRKAHTHAGHSHEVTPDDQEFAAAKAAHEAQQARFEAAIARPKWIALALRVLGVLLAAAGIWGYLAGRHGSR